MRPILALRYYSLLLLALLAACQGLPRQPGSEPTAPASADSAASAQQRGDYVLAAREYGRLAQANQPPARTEYQLKEVDMLLKAGQLAAARERIKGVNTNGQAPGLRVRKLLAQAQIAAAEGQADPALRYVADAEKTRNVDPSVWNEVYQVRAEIELALGRPFAAVRSLIKRESHLAAPETLSENRKRIWSILVAQERTALEQERQKSRDGVLTGWLDLALAARAQAPASRALALALTQWRQTYGAHPANIEILPTLLTGAPGLVGSVKQLAILLPLSSPYGSPAAAVRDGFIAMHTADRNPDKPLVRVYDVGADPATIGQFYSTAIAEGAQFVVGPLGVESINRLAHESELGVPTLLLGHTDTAVDFKTKLVFQFGLPPEQEAAQVAERASLQGLRRAAVLFPDNIFGRRMQAAFESQWSNLGGSLIASRSYETGKPEYSVPVKALLNLEQAEERQRRVQNATGLRLKSEPRPRQDLEFIFLVADPKHARLIKPQLDYFGAQGLPVYSTSHIFAGAGNAANDIDLDGIIFADMPWMLVGNGKIAQMRERIQQAWPGAGTPNDRLYALGMDAYALLPHLNRLAADPAARFHGVTAVLGVDGEGRLRRQLLWARFRGGLPRLLDTFTAHKDYYVDDPTGAPTTGPAR